MGLTETWAPRNLPPLVVVKPRPTRKPAVKKEVNDGD